MTTVTAPQATNGQSGRLNVQAQSKEVVFKPFLEDEPITLSIKIIKEFLCTPTKSGKVCSDAHAVRFIMLCKARQLNPFTGDAYLIGFDSQNGAQFNLVTAHQAFLKRAEVHPKYDGMRSGVVVMDGSKQPNDREGDFVMDGETLLGGWATVYLKDVKHPIYRRLRLSTFNTGRSRWATDPAGMIVKCAEADALRSSFPNSIGGMYLEGESDHRPAVASSPSPPSTSSRLAYQSLPDADEQFQSPAIEDPHPDPPEDVQAPPDPSRDEAERNGVAERLANDLSECVNDGDFRNLDAIVKEIGEQKEFVGAERHSQLLEAVQRVHAAKTAAEKAASKRGR